MKTEETKFEMQQEPEKFHAEQETKEDAETMQEKETEEKMKKEKSVFKHENEKIKKFVQSRRKILIIAAVILAVAIAAVGYCSSNIGYRRPIKKIVHVINSREVELDALAKAVLPGNIRKSCYKTLKIFDENSYLSDSVNSLETELNNKYVKMDNYYGADSRISIKVLKKEKMSKSQLRGAQSSYRGFYENYFEDLVSEMNNSDYERINSYAREIDLSEGDVRQIADTINNIADYLKNVNITKGYNLTVEYTVKGSKDVYSAQTNLRVLKMDGEWVLDYSSSGYMGNIISRLRGYVWNFM